MYVQAAQHGREINGTEALRRFHDRLLSTDTLLSGEVITIPVADPLTFDYRSYTTPEEIDSINPNMNRVWPGDAEGSLHEQLAAALWNVATDADTIIDLHTSSAKTLPHVVYTADDKPSQRLANTFGTTLIIPEPTGSDAQSEWHSRDFSGKFRVAAHEAGIPCITPELGDSRRIQEGPIETGVNGIVNVLRAVGALSGDPAENDPVACRNHLGRIRAAESGVFRPSPHRSLGERVTEGNHLGTLYDPSTYKQVQEATADNDGILYAMTQGGAVTAGDRLCNVAIPLANK